MPKQTKKWRKVALTIIFFCLSVSLQVAGLNFFLIPNDIFSVGLNGIAQLMSLSTAQFFGWHIQTGVFFLLFNIPIGIVGFKMVGGKFTILSFLNAVVVSFLLIFLPTFPFTTQPLLATLFGGLLVGAAIGVAMRYGFSTGGFDIIAMIIQKRTGKSIGAFMNVANGVIVLIAGFFIGWQNAMYTLIGIYATGQVVDTLYTGYQKLTAMIVTSKGEEVVDVLHRDLIRGITILPSSGAYTKRESTTLMMVLSRFELFEMQEAVRSVDPKAFINLLSTVSVAGEFWDADRQLQMKKSIGPKAVTIDAQLEAEQQLEEQLAQIQAQKEHHEQ
ncbi:YitT family protein [Fructobacillus sp. M1-13]|uniref:YitT family protein n=1 Tax=Fructobacillus papyriferae TaxID=2713171 RepID=A0ABS5QP52_9LACO|nr:YitT family protein [Fructobacillus papyriferae]MBS9334841.1 YitT family protein [Fructobacillus papyriferae]MCD2158831.1 YitT family protein [Fructobacillus papyriferae]